MRIRKISDEVFKEYSHLEGISSTDFYQVWKSYEQEIEGELLKPTLPYLQFLSIGTFYVSKKAFYKQINNFKQAFFFVDHLNIINTDYEKLKNKVKEYKRITNSKKEFFSKFLIYLDGIDNQRVRSSLNFYNQKIKEFEELLTEADKIIEEYDKRIITRDLEKQDANS